MNIFYLDHSPAASAVAMCDKHVVKMILETCQLLSTAHNVLDGEGSGPYKTTHKNHPSAVWVRQSITHYEWLHRHLLALLDEYNYRYRRYHACNPIAVVLVNTPRNIPVHVPFTTPPLCMPDEYKVKGDAPASYRNYYRHGKKHLLKYTRRHAPSWIAQP